MIDRNSEISLVKQCELLSVSRAMIYYVPKGETALNLALMRLIDEQHLKKPSYGVERMRAWVNRQGYCVSSKRVRRLMSVMGLMAIYQKPKLSKPNEQHEIYPYLLRDRAITRANEVWCTDITYIPMPRGFMYLTAVMDWHSRKVLSWRLSNTMDVGFCVEALTEALEKYGVPEVFNTDQGSQFTSEKFTQVLKDHQIKISMDGKGRWVDNVMIERLWRSVKYECVYINVYESGSGLRLGLKDWFESYNADRPHQGLNDRTPDEVYFGIKSAGCLQSNIA